MSKKKNPSVVAPRTRNPRLAAGSDRGEVGARDTLSALQGHNTLKDKLLSVSFIGPCVWLRLNGWPNKSDEMPFLKNHLHFVWNAGRKRFVNYNGYKPTRVSKLDFPSLVNFYQGGTVFGKEV